MMPWGLEIAHTIAARWLLAYPIPEFAACLHPYPAGASPPLAMTRGMVETRRSILRPPKAQSFDRLEVVFLTISNFDITLMECIIWAICTENNTVLNTPSNRKRTRLFFVGFYIISDAFSFRDSVKIAFNSRNQGIIIFRIKRSWLSDRRLPTPYRQTFNILHYCFRGTCATL